MLIIGFSTGALAFGDFNKGLSLLNPTRANAVELSALRSSELPTLLAALPGHLAEWKKRYKYISLHAPTDVKDERDTVRCLSAVAELGLSIIVHPDIIHDIYLWKQLGSNICIENMDTRKPVGRTAKELRVFFSSLPQARLCFDVAHARQVDPTMIEANRILLEFGDRLGQVHVSEVDGVGKHFPMSYSAKHAFTKFAHILSRAPIILESIVRAGAIEHEIDEAWEIFSPVINLSRLHGDGASMTV